MSEIIETEGRERSRDQRPVSLMFRVSVLSPYFRVSVLSSLFSASAGDRPTSLSGKRWGRERMGRSGREMARQRESERKRE